ncbi:ribonucleotide reductase of class Ib (aerobic) beta subunit [Staphylococcus phage PMBT8]|nr:ribonucleotide reductase of class Ib (aerobic) beta subunit [Staphylococcus phage PMBT8]
MVLTAGNWNRKDDNYSEMFILQNLKQFWLPEEISLSNDVLSWNTLTNDERDTYSKVLAGLTLLDTLQGDIGMSKIAEHVESHQKKAVFSFMGGMENAVHARSYSNIFLTLETSQRINELFDWVKENEFLQRKGTIINKYYKNIVDDYSLAQAMAASVALETFLFYSGFYYPLYMAGQGKLVGSGEIINLIIRDESIHGVYTGLNYQEIVNKLPSQQQEELKQFTIELFDELMDNEIGYTRFLYDQVDLAIDVIDFVKYNANKALNNLGYDAMYEHDDPNPIVLNGLNVGRKTHDFFSVKGDSYKKATVIPIQDDDFNF